MKTKVWMIFLGTLGLFGACVLVTGCVGTVSGGKTAGVPFIRDTVQGLYERSVNQVYDAAKAVVSDNNGTLVSETILHTETNEVKTITGKVAQNTVWVRVAPVDATVTSVAVQTRAKSGGSDIELAHELEKQIALKLVR